LHPSVRCPEKSALRPPRQADIPDDLPCAVHGQREANPAPQGVKIDRGTVDGPERGVKDAVRRLGLTDNVALRIHRIGKPFFAPEGAQISNLPHHPQHRPPIALRLRGAGGIAYNRASLIHPRRRAKQ